MDSRVNLGELLDQYVDQLVDSERFNSQTEVLREGVRLVLERETWQDYVDGRVTAGIAADDADDVIDGEASFEELLAKYVVPPKSA